MKIAYRKKRYPFLAIAFLSCTFGPHAALANDDSPKTPPSDVLQRIALADANYQMGLQKAVMASNAVKTWHKHIGPEVVYVLEGQVTLAKRDSEKTYMAGDSFQTKADVAHQTTAGPEGAVVLATWVVEQGKKFAVPVDE